MRSWQANAEAGDGGPNANQRGRVQRVSRPISHQGTQDVGSEGTAEQKSHQRYHQCRRKGVKMAVDQAGGHVGYTNYLDTSRSLINPSWVTWARVSVVRPETTQDTTLMMCLSCTKNVC